MITKTGFSAEQRRFFYRRQRHDAAERPGVFRAATVPRGNSDAKIRRGLLQTDIAK